MTAAVAGGQAAVATTEVAVISNGVLESCNGYLESCNGSEEMLAAASFDEVLQLCAERNGVDEVIS